MATALQWLHDSRSNPFYPTERRHTVFTVELFTGSLQHLPLLSWFPAVFLFQMLLFPLLNLLRKKKTILLHNIFLFFTIRAFYINPVIYVDLIDLLWDSVCLEIHEVVSPLITLCSMRCLRAWLLHSWNIEHIQSRFIKICRMYGKKRFIIYKKDLSALYLSQISIFKNLIFNITVFFLVPLFSIFPFYFLSTL